MQEENSLAFTVVSDPGNGTAARLGILTRPSSGAVRAAELLVEAGLTSLNADGTRNLAMPATVILDRNRTVRWIDVHPHQSTKPRQVIVALDYLVEEKK
jgi:peroxiredoxin